MSGDVVVWHSHGCSPCDRVMEYLKKKGVPYVEHNITEDEQARDRFMAKGFLSVPVTEIGGEVVLGFDPKSLDAALAKLS